MKVRLIFEHDKKKIPKEIVFHTDIKSEKDIPDILRDLADFIEAPALPDADLT